MLLAVCAGCEDSGTFSPEEYIPTTGYAIPEQNYVAFFNEASVHELKVSCEGDWTCSSDSEWVTAERSKNGDSVIISVSENSSADYRMAIVALYMNDFKIYSIEIFQDPSVASPMTDVLIFTPDAYSRTVNVSANCSWTCSSDSDWVSAVKNSDVESMTVSVNQNQLDVERTAVVGIYNGESLLSTVSIKQERPYAYVGSDIVTFRSVEASQSFNVNSNCSSWTCSVDSDWIFAENQNKGTNILIGVRENTTSAPRTATVRLSAGELKLSEITVIQKAADTYLAQTPEERANCYVISKAGNYIFPTFKGNSTVSAGSVASAEVLWESFGTSVKPDAGDLIRDVVLVTDVALNYANISFSTPSEFKEGNAVIAAKDAAGKILWSWHIWLTDQPQEQVYYNNAGTMMDRNLGAISASPGDLGALGLLYQWGRKDPFLNSSVFGDEVVAESTITWPSVINSTSSTGTIDYVVSHPTTFVYSNGYNYDWYYTGDSSSDTSRWTTSDKPKSMYDPCPAGWRVPDGGTDGVWAKAGGTSSNVVYDTVNNGINFAGEFGSDSVIWYPGAGGLSSDYNDTWSAGELMLVGTSGDYWTATHEDKPYGSNDIFASELSISRYGTTVDVLGDSSHAYGHSVRCIKE